MNTIFVQIVSPGACARREWGALWWAKRCRKSDTQWIFQELVDTKQFFHQLIIHSRCFLRWMRHFFCFLMNECRVNTNLLLKSWVMVWNCKLVAIKSWFTWVQLVQSLVWEVFVTATCMLSMPNSGFDAWFRGFLAISCAALKGMKAQKSTQRNGNTRYNKF